MESIYRKLRITKDSIEVANQIVKEFFTLNEFNEWVHGRCDLEIARYKSMAEAGKRGAQIRWAKGGDTHPTDPPMPINNKELIIKNKNINTPEGVSDDLWKEFLVYRKKLKAPVTDRIVNRLVKEAGLAKMPLSEVLELIMFKGWRSFEASWAKGVENKRELPLTTDQQIEYAYIHEIGGDPSKARFGSYREMREFILKKRGEK
jgi:hypothetical protein